MQMAFDTRRPSPLHCRPVGQPAAAASIHEAQEGTIVTANPTGQSGSDEPEASCAHPWLRVTCGVCGEAVDALGLPEMERPPSEQEGAVEETPGLFIVARGHPDLVEQLRALMGHQSGVQIIEDRRQGTRAAPPTPDEAAALRAALRRRVLESGAVDPGAETE